MSSEWSDKEAPAKMSESNLYRTENYQNYINSFHRKPRVEKSISEVRAKIDDDNESINSVAESLNNYLDVKVCLWLLSVVLSQRCFVHS